METRWSRIMTGVAAVLSAALVGIAGVGVIAPETARAAGVVVEHRAYGSALSTTGREQD